MCLTLLELAKVLFEPHYGLIHGREQAFQGPGLQILGFNPSVRLIEGVFAAAVGFARMLDDGFEPVLRNLQ